MGKRLGAIVGGLGVALMVFGYFYNRIVAGLGVLVALGVFGYFYNRLVAWLEEQGYDEGYTAYMVVGGVIVTEIGAGIIVYALLWRGVCVMGEDALGVAAMSLGLHMLAYLASGLPMIIGATLRHAQERRAGQDSLRKQ